MTVPQNTKKSRHFIIIIPQRARTISYKHFKFYD